ncbi:hypothetical protein CLIB1423_01S02608 [[Candida] railenensis]|uniref:Transcription regulator LGE1 helical region domain-containing protein n=1 Tax=[Candida] railenensis TaxID=45579 RepID=A0A9P0QK34_9ASCO|nr:hypothetical protein CLIB1423_01S02608 [[Candida] railenensis]
MDYRGDSDYYNQRNGGGGYRGSRGGGNSGYRGGRGGRGSGSGDQQSSSYYGNGSRPGRQQLPQNYYDHYNDNTGIEDPGYAPSIGGTGYAQNAGYNQSAGHGYGQAGTSNYQDRRYSGGSSRPGSSYSERSSSSSSYGYKGRGSHSGSVSHSYQQQSNSQSAGQYSRSHSQSQASPQHRSKSSAAQSHSHWVEILQIKDESTAKTLDIRQNELDAVDKTLLELNQARHNLEISLSHLERHAQNEDLNVQITNEKLEEFSYL